MANYITFTGAMVTVEAPAGTPGQEVAAMARKAFLDQLDTFQPHDIGVNIVAVN